MLCGITGAFAQNTPRYAASTHTWTFGKQTWSDAIHVPECSKANFTDSYTLPGCRSYTENGKTWYYYNWAYVDRNNAALCPSPWRMPAKPDFETLANHTNNNALIGAWGYGGYATGSSVSSAGSNAYYWSSAEHGNASACSLTFGMSGYVYSQDYWAKYLGFQVRCVK
jgi:hypothetical protein